MVYRFTEKIAEILLRDDSIKPGWKLIPGKTNGMCNVLGDNMTSWLGGNLAGTF